jgi:hypothetical protein
VGLGATLGSVVGGEAEVLLTAGLVVGGLGPSGGEPPDAHPLAPGAIMPATSSVASSAEVRIGHHLPTALAYFLRQRRRASLRSLEKTLEYRSISLRGSRFAVTAASS